MKYLRLKNFRRFLKNPWSGRLSEKQIARSIEKENINATYFDLQYL